MFKTKNRENLETSIIDFGMSMDIRGNETRFGMDYGTWGSHATIAPEVVQCKFGDGRFNKAADIWGIGCIAFQLAGNGLAPFYTSYKYNVDMNKGTDDVLKGIHNAIVKDNAFGDKTIFSNGITHRQMITCPKYFDFIKRCLTFDTTQSSQEEKGDYDYGRCTADDALKHEIFNGLREADEKKSKDSEKSKVCGKCDGSGYYYETGFSPKTVGMYIVNPVCWFWSSSRAHYKNKYGSKTKQVCDECKHIISIAKESPNAVVVDRRRLARHNLVLERLLSEINV